MAIITISRGTFTGGRQLANCVAEKLGYRCISGEMLLEVASEYGAPVDKLSKAISSTPGILERMTADRDRYLAYIKAALYKEAKADNLVYHGHAGHLLLEDVPHVLKVRIVASVEYRVKQVMERSNLNSKEAARIIREVDDERKKWTKLFYHVDWSDPAIYDIVINLDQISLNSACETVCLASGLEHFKSTPMSRKLVDDLALNSYIMAMLAADRNIVTDGIEITSVEGIVTLSGSTQWAQGIDKIVKETSRVPGVNKVINKIKIGTSWADIEGLKVR